MKFSHELERIFFESTIIGIDFSRWGEFVSLIVLSRWNELDGIIYPVSEIVVVNFREVAEFDLVRSEAIGHESEACFPDLGIEVNHVDVSDGVEVIIHSTYFKKFNIKFNGYDFFVLERDVVNFVKILQRGNSSMIRFDMKFLFYEFGRAKRR
ncbi:hypothetical protein [Burkholderia savannae]|uniref:hypothetical protein n=1 Tax=Burkholderia savannae TaxID=1637837 RepID=UPI0012E3AABC|nr:hypothetical protein [Burkholderia savannae]